MVNSEGQSGEKATFGQRAAWMDFYGKRQATGYEGIAILQHPSNKWFPSPWFTRDYGFMSPTPMNWPEDGEATHLKKGEKVKLRYRVIVHGGTVDEAGISRIYEKYKSE